MNFSLNFENIESDKTNGLIIKYKSVLLVNKTYILTFQIMDNNTR